MGTECCAPSPTGFVSCDFCQSPQLPHPFLHHRCNETGSQHPEVMSADSVSELKQLAASRSGCPAAQLALWAGQLSASGPTHGGQGGLQPGIFEFNPPHSRAASCSLGSSKTEAEP